MKPKFNKGDRKFSLFLSDQYMPKFSDEIIKKVEENYNARMGDKKIQDMNKDEKWNHITNNSEHAEKIHRKMSRRKSKLGI